MSENIEEYTTADAAAVVDAQNVRDGALWAWRATNELAMSAGWQVMREHVLTRKATLMAELATNTALTIEQVRFLQGQFLSLSEVENFPAEVDQNVRAVLGVGNDSPIA